MSEDEGLTPERLVANYQDIELPQDSGLEGVDNVDWSLLTHAHGPAGDVPALLKAALSNSEADREFAIELLFETIWHQGTVYEASAFAVPYLYRMLESPNTPDRWRIAQLLAMLADGNSYLEAHAASERQAAAWRAILAKQGKDFETVRAIEIEWVQKTRAAVGQRLELLYPYLADQGSPIKQYIAIALSRYPERASETLPLLKRAAATEMDAYDLEEINRAIVKLGMDAGHDRPVEPKV